MEVKFSWVGQDRPNEIIKRFEKFEVDVKDARELWPNIIRDFGRREEEHFAAGAFAPLRPDYAAWKFSQVGGEPILTFSHNLRSSLTDPGRFVLEVGAQKLSLGTDVPYAKYHQEGYVAKARGGTIEEVVSAAKTKLLKKGHPQYQQAFSKLLEQQRRKLRHSVGEDMSPQAFEEEAQRRALKILRDSGGVRVVTQKAVYRKVHTVGKGRTAVPARPPLISNRAAYGAAWRGMAVRWVRDELREAGLAPD